MHTESSTTDQALENHLAEADYTRRRLYPSRFDLDYLMLTDLRALVATFADSVTGKLLDFGCGGAPYRPLFTKCDAYHGADITPGSDIDYVIQKDGTLDELDDVFDAVLSSQVLEHVTQPDQYLRECHRVLKPGGRMLVSTHGMFVEHACPHDYTRWTGTGIKALLEDSGFDVVQTYKLTTDARAAIQTQHYLMLNWRTPSRGATRVLNGIVRRLYAWLLRPLLNVLGAATRNCSVVEATSPSNLYVGVAALVTKPVTR
jgi:SAM-dependent methyltransferase